MAAKAFWTSFFDGLTGEGIFGDLRIPDVPTRMFAPEAPEHPIFTLRLTREASLSPEDIAKTRAAIMLAVDAINVAADAKGMIVVDPTDTSKDFSFKHAAS
jgi:hypothetical protein